MSIEIDCDPHWFIGSRRKKHKGAGVSQDHQSSSPVSLVANKNDSPGSTLSLQRIQPKHGKRSEQQRSERGISFLRRRSMPVASFASSREKRIRMSKKFRANGKENIAVEASALSSERAVCPEYPGCSRSQDRRRTIRERFAQLESLLPANPEKESMRSNEQIAEESYQSTIQHENAASQLITSICEELEELNSQSNFSLSLKDIKDSCAVSFQMAKESLMNNGDTDDFEKYMDTAADQFFTDMTRESCSQAMLCHSCGSYHRHNVITTAEKVSCSEIDSPSTEFQGNLIVEGNGNHSAEISDRNQSDCPVTDLNTPQRETTHGSSCSLEQTPVMKCKKWLAKNCLSSQSQESTPCSSVRKRKRSPVGKKRLTYPSCDNVLLSNLDSPEYNFNDGNGDNNLVNKNLAVSETTSLDLFLSPLNLNSSESQPSILASGDKTSPREHSPIVGHSKLLVEGSAVPSQEDLPSKGLPSAYKKKCQGYDIFKDSKTYRGIRRFWKKPYDGNGLGSHDLDKTSRENPDGMFPSDFKNVVGEDGTSFTEDLIQKPLTFRICSYGLFSQINKADSHSSTSCGNVNGKQNTTPEFHIGSKSSEFHQAENLNLSRDVHEDMEYCQSPASNEHDTESFSESETSNSPCGEASKEIDVSAEEQSPVFSRKSKANCQSSCEGTNYFNFPEPLSSQGSSKNGLPSSGRRLVVRTLRDSNSEDPNDSYITPVGSSILPFPKAAPKKFKKYLPADPAPKCRRSLVRKFQSMSPRGIGLLHTPPSTPGSDDFALLPLEDDEC